MTELANLILALVSILTFLLVLLLLYVEFHYFLYPGYKFRFAPDSQFTGKLKLNVDLTVAMPCDCKPTYLPVKSNFLNICSGWG